MVCNIKSLSSDTALQTVGRRSRTDYLGRLLTLCLSGHSALLGIIATILLESRSLRDWYNIELDPDYYTK